MTAKEYIKNDDIYGALERLNNSTKQWRTYWFNTCLAILTNCKKLAKKFIIDKTTETIVEIIETVKKVRNNFKKNIICECDLLDNAKEKCYLFEFYNNNNELICSKVGTTTRTIKQRLMEELRSKTYTEMGATKAIVKRVYDCGEKPAEGAESYIRAHYIKKYPNSFKKNDRFINEYFDYIECDKMMNEYLSL